MASSKDDGKKDPTRAGDPKRPHATLDLKAVEIKPVEPRAAAPGGSAQKDDAGKASAASASTLPSSKAPQTSAKADEKSAAAGGIAAGAAGGASAGDLSNAAAASAKSTTKTAPGEAPPSSARRGGGIGGFFTHIAAGIVGGFLALAGADTLGQQFGIRIGGNDRAPQSEELASRIVALERTVKSAASGADADFAERLASQAARLEKLEGVEARLTSLAETQTRLEAETQALAKRPTESVAAAVAPDPRIDRLEEKLALLASAAEGSKGEAAIPQLATVTGKLADLETTVSSQLKSLRESVTAEIETRIAKAAESAEAARSGTLRIDRDLSDIKTDGARISQRIETLKADNQRFSAAIAAVKEEVGNAASSLDALKSDIAQRFKTVVKPDDMAAAVAPVTARLGDIEKRVQSVVTAEQSRKASAERIVLSLELANLKRVVDRGLGYGDELAQVKKAAAGRIDLAPLERYKIEGVPTLPELQASFRPLTHQIIDAATQPADGGVIERLLAGAKSVVRVRKVNHRPDDGSVEAVVARMDKALDEGRIGDFVSLAETLPVSARAPATSLLQKVEARHAVDKALSEIQNQLKSSIGGAGEAASATK